MVTRIDNGKRKRTVEQRLADMIWLESRVMRGVRQPDRLAKELAEIRPYAISASQMKQDLAKLRKKWNETLIADIQDAKGAMLRDLDEQKIETWAAWDQSKKGHTKSLLRKKHGAGKGDGAKAAEPASGVPVESIAEHRSEPGDPAYQRILLEIHDKKVALLGLAPPIKLESSGPDGGPIKTEGVNVNLNATIPGIGVLISNEAAAAILARFVTVTVTAAPVPAPDGADDGETATTK